jgi:hemolysin III
MIAKLRDPVSGLTHFFAAIVAAVGLVSLLIFGWGNLGKEISLLIYGLSLIQMFSASATYHMVPAEPGAAKLRVLRKIDHSAIFILIAGTYTPLCFNLFSGFWKWGLLAIIWSLAIIGVIVKIFIINAPRWISTGVYLVMGWICILAFNEMMRVVPLAGVIWLILGGVFFTIGAVIYATKRMDFFPGIFGFHETWHIFVILGCICHFILILVFVAQAV